MGKKIDIIGVYRRLGKKTKKNTWVNLIKKCKKKNGIILTGDFNAHHSLWNCERSDENGELLLEEMKDR